MPPAAAQEEFTTTTSELILPLRILLVEDDEFDVAVFRRAFRKSEIPCEIIRCSRAEEVLEGLEGAEVSLDLLVTDHHLPGMSGLDLCLQLLENRPPFALVLLTGGGSELVAIRALKAGVQEYIVKDSSRDYLEILPLVLRQVARRHRDRMARRRAEAALRKSRDQAIETLCTRLGSRLEHELLAATGELQVVAEDLITREGVEDSAKRLNGVLESLRSLHERVPEMLQGPGKTTRPMERNTESPSPTLKRLPIDSLNPPRVLIAHANPVVAFVTARNIERLGLRYVPASTGPQVLEALEREPFDLLLIDLEIPGLDGYETARRIRELENGRGGHMPILALAVDPLDSLQHRCQEAGIDDLVSRPVSMASLRETLSRILEP